MLQSHGSQGPSHSFKYKGRTNALKGAGEMLATGKPAQLSGGESQRYKRRAGASGIQNSKAKIEKKKKKRESERDGSCRLDVQVQEPFLLC